MTALSDPERFGLDGVAGHPHNPGTSGRPQRHRAKRIMASEGPLVPEVAHRATRSTV